MMLDSSTYVENLWKIEKIEPNDNEIEIKLQAFLERMTIDFKQIYDDKEAMLNNLEVKINTAEDIFKSGLESKSQKLNDIHIQVKAAIHKFKQASENAVRIGDRLASTENERKILVRATDIIKTIDCLQRINPIIFQDILQDSLNFMTLKNSLSDTLHKKDIRSFCSLLLDLRKVLIDIKSDQVADAQINIIALSQFVESELLDEFESCITKLTQFTVTQQQQASLSSSSSSSSSPISSIANNEVQILRQTQDLAECLYYFAEGDSLEKRYLFSVVQVMFRQSDTSANGSRNNSHAYDDDDDDDRDEVNDSHKPRVDLLSQLFGNISNICKQQFEVIAKVFPIKWGYRVMRLLVLRIFNDPAFGIQTYIDQSLYPASPQPPLSLGEYLNMLGNVREKLSAFHIILADYCCTYGFIDDVKLEEKHRGVSSSSSSSSGRGYDNYNDNSLLSHHNDDTNNDNINTIIQSNTNTNDTTNDDNDGTFSIQLTDAEILIISNETKAFLLDQISQVFTVYIAEYFQKEFTHLKFQYQRCLSRAISDDHTTGKYLHKALTTTTVLSSLTTLKAEKLKNIPNIERTIGNHEFVETVFNQTADTMSRMMNIARDDKKLSSKMKDLYIIHMKFLFESVFLPITTATTVFLLKQATASPQSSALPPIEFLGILGCILTAIDRNRAQFSRQFSPFFVDAPNLLVVCKEARKTALHGLMINAKESLVAWGVCVTSHIDKMLLSLQSKHDYLPQHDDDSSLPIISDGKIIKKGAIECTGACTHVCKAIVMVVQSVLYHRAEFSNLDLKQSLWKYIGRLLVGVLMTHIRRNKISQGGGRRLVKDLEEYFQILTLLEVTETLDLMYSVKEIAVLFITPSQRVAQVVIETLRHLDYRIVTALLCARSDYGTATGAVWVNELTSVYGSCAPTQSFPWEDRRRHLALLHFKAAVALETSGGGGGTTSSSSSSSATHGHSSSSTQSYHLSFGPLTLRKSSAPLSAAFMLELKEMNFPNTAAYVYTQEVLANSSSFIGRIPPRNNHQYNNENGKSSRHHGGMNNSRYGGSKYMNGPTSASISSIAQKGFSNLSNLVPVSTANFITHLVKESNERRLNMGLTMNNDGRNGNESVSARSEKSSNNNMSNKNKNINKNNRINDSNDNNNNNDDGDDDDDDDGNNNDNDEQQQQQQVKRKKKKSSSATGGTSGSAASTTLAMLEKQKTKMMTNISNFFS